ncbi:MAG: hypothetical protein U0Z53_10845 [Blastocatellia bacterium]
MTLVTAEQVLTTMIGEISRKLKGQIRSGCVMSPGSYRNNVGLTGYISFYPDGDVSGVSTDLVIEVKTGGRYINLIADLLNSEGTILGEILEVSTPIRDDETVNQAEARLLEETRKVVTDKSIELLKAKLRQE